MSFPNQDKRDFNNGAFLGKIISLQPIGFTSIGVN
jgi:hypothetical protein